MAEPGTTETDRAVADRVEELLAQLTLEEKAGQLTQLFYFGNLAAPEVGATIGIADDPTGSVEEALGRGARRLAALRHRPGADQPAAAPRRGGQPPRHPAALRLRRHPRPAHDPAGADRPRGVVGPADDRARPGRRRPRGAGGRHPLDLRPDGRHRPRPALGPDHRGRRGGPVPRAPRSPPPRCAASRAPAIGTPERVIAGPKHFAGYGCGARRPGLRRGQPVRLTTAGTSCSRPSGPPSRPAPATS